MPDSTNSSSDLENCQAEVARLNKIVRSLMDRAERSTNAQGSDFSLFQTTIMLEEQVRRRTEELEAALTHNQLLQVQLREQAIRDSLTGLFNRHSLNEFFDREIRLAARHDRPITVVMGDLDHFKSINDTYGHLAGDEVLRVFGDLLKRSYRASDIHCRYGGEEFLIVLPDMTNDCACERTEQLRAKIQITPVVFGPSVIHFTASFGVATFPQHSETCDALIAAADRALYAAKNGGRNRVKTLCEHIAAS